MPIQGRLPFLLRLLRLAAALSLIIALVAVATILSGDPVPGSQALVVVAIGLGSSALLGMALTALHYTRRKKEWNDRQP